MSISISHENGVESVEYNETNNFFHIFYPCSNTWECSAFKIVFPPGLYFLEVWGAQGGNATGRSGVGGFGGYSSGIFQPNKTTNLYLHIGGSTPGLEPSKSSYNGGTEGQNLHDGPGGGATDFRYSSGKWDFGFDSRIIVAGGGGGAFANAHGGNGGGTNGYAIQVGSIQPCYGAQNGCEGRIGEPRLDGTLGKGGGPGYGSGGGGYWGGGNAINCGGGGGSGFVGGVSSIEYFEKKTISSTHTGNGEAKIHILKIFPEISCNFVLSKTTNFSNFALLFLFILK